MVPQSSGMMVCLSVACAALVGCSGASDAPPKAITTGNVTYQGEPVEDGMIRFIPVTGPPVQTQIVNGTYLVDYKGGVALGTARVEIDGFRGTGNVVAVSPEQTQPETEQFIPRKYNEESTLSVEITRDDPNTHDFLLD